jgi:acetolactate synthase-1/3 small subunit
MKHTLSILLQNEAGALVRVAGLFAARNCNIDSLTVVMHGAEATVQQIIEQTRKLVDVIEVSRPVSLLHS